MICLLPVTNAPKGNPAWKKVKCPRCGKECWLTTKTKAPAVCIDCALGDLKVSTIAVKDTC